MVMRTGRSISANKIELLKVVQQETLQMRTEVAISVWTLLARSLREYGFCRKYMPLEMPFCSTMSSV